MDLDFQAAQIGLDAGFSRLWMVGEDYEIRNGRLFEIGPGKRFIAPAGSPPLVKEIGHLHEGNEAAVLEFARTWGLLGWWAMVHTRFSNAPDRLTEIGRDARFSDEDPRAGEPLGWIWAHARGIRLVMSILAYLRNNDLVGLQSLLRSLAASDLAEATSLTYGVHEMVNANLVISGDENPVTFGWTIVQTIVNANLRGGIGEELEVHHVGGGKFIGRQARNFGSLSDVIYWHLFQLCQSLDQTVACAECGHLFLRTDRRQRFCPPSKWKTPEGEERGPSESTCAKRARMRRLRGAAAPGGAEEK